MADYDDDYYSSGSEDDVVVISDDNYNTLVELDFADLTEKKYIHLVDWVQDIILLYTNYIGVSNTYKTIVSTAVATFFEDYYVIPSGPQPHQHWIERIELKLNKIIEDVLSIEIIAPRRYLNGARVGTVILSELIFNTDSYVTVDDPVSFTVDGLLEFFGGEEDDDVDDNQQAYNLRHKVYKLLSNVYNNHVLSEQMRALCLFNYDVDFEECGTIRAHGSDLVGKILIPAMTMDPDNDMDEKNNWPDDIPDDMEMYVYYYQQQLRKLIKHAFYDLVKNQVEKYVDVDHMRITDYDKHKNVISIINDMVGL
jgi:hypothetical protein